MPASTVADIMSSSVVSVRPDTHYTEIAALLHSYALGSVPVLDADRHLLGVVGGADLLRAAYYRGPFARSNWKAGHGPRVAEDLMTRDVTTVDPSTTLPEAAALMLARRRRWLPVVDEDRVVGVLSRSDVLQVLTRSDSAIRADLLMDLDQLFYLMAATTTDRETGENTIEVIVHDGTVSLTGRLPIRSVAEAAVSAARAVDGVLEVEDHLTYGVDDHQLELLTGQTC